MKISRCVLPSHPSEFFPLIQNFPVIFSRWQKFPDDFFILVLEEIVNFMAARKTQREIFIRSDSIIGDLHILSVISFHDTLSCRLRKTKNSKVSPVAHYHFRTSMFRSKYFHKTLVILHAPPRSRIHFYISWQLAFMRISPKIKKENFMPTYLGDLNRGILDNYTRT